MRVGDGDAEAQEDSAEARDQVIRVAAEAWAEAQQAHPQEDGEGAGVEHKMPDRLAVGER